MAPASSRDPRSRQACQSCRRKKIKCPAEKPECSACQRLSQKCEYRAKEDVKPPPRRSVARPLRKAPARAAQQISSNSTAGHGMLSLPVDQDPLAAAVEQPAISGDSLAISFHNPEMRSSLNVLNNLVDMYQASIHLQPIPLFGCGNLCEYLLSAPQHLLHSFLALTLKIGTHTPVGDDSQVLASAEDYSRSARHTTCMLALQGVESVEVVQSLCLQALADIMMCKPRQAWMTIGTASRLMACCIPLGEDSLGFQKKKELNIRSVWSVFILEKIFSPHLCATSKYLGWLDYPSSAPLPPRISSSAGDDSIPDLYDEDEMTTDRGILAYHIQMVSLWGDVASWLHSIRLGSSEMPWLPDSHHAKLSAKYFEVERQIPHQHLLRNLSFTKRSVDEVAQNREYWVPWMLMQVMFHGIPAMINHPFLHLVALRRGSRGPQSQAFLQQTVDLALFHSAWVFRLLKVCESHQLQICDPLVGHIVAALAIVPWLFQFAVDEKVSQKASEDLAWCQEFLGRSSRVWPHMLQKLEVLQSLQRITDHRAGGKEEGGNMITFQPSLVWALLDPDICHMNLPKIAPEEASEHMPEARLRVTTRFTHPLTEAHSNQQAGGSSTWGLDDPFWFNPSELEQVQLDDLFFNSALDQLGHF